MRKREEILKDRTRPDILAVEILLDIRDLLVKQIPKRKYTKHSKVCVKKGDKT